MSRFSALLAGALLTALALPAAPAQAAAPDPDVVAATDAGPVHGSAHDGYRTFQGIPYAAPPTGDLRWRDPQPVTPWSGVREATAPGNRCPQGTTGDEDCLYLNVTAPAGAERRPVVVWLHGGSFTGGAGSDYDPHRMAVDGDVVVVTVNYRLGIYGYFGYPGLAGSGDFGLADQQAALRWVRRNAAAFGGDPANVTLAGQSAGGMSVCSQLTSPSAEGLFDKAIIQSGSCLIDYPKALFWPTIPAGSPWTGRTAVETAGSGLGTTLGCADIACLRGKPAAELAGHLGEFAKPAYDTPLLPAEPAQALRDGRFHRVPVLQGGNRDEHRSFVAVLDKMQPITEQRYHDLLAQSFGAQADAVAERYPASDYPSPAVAWATVATDRIWSCPTLQSDRLLARHTPVYTYEFADRGAPAPPGLPAGFPYGAYHASELPYLFDVAGLPATLDPGQQRLADRMIHSWTRFATTGHPWSRFDDGEARSLAPGEGARTVDLEDEHNCDLWLQDS
ncbi:carboxylesterase/lipase family protein [Kitasatospora aureofaciens]|uniref:carboxylesterase/lipase family protein n=1 Tax=Kitasatospora aureofaciens TaxID=1894 RepID=UPI001C45919E|nr:carboxylesterase family protein [Kitasatospora aureofaciens]MBV6697692.1 carboxylesterase family protein [Kitasatospora aureofaciens]